MPEIALAEDSTTDFAPLEMELEAPEIDLPTEVAISVIVSVIFPPSLKAESRFADPDSDELRTGARIGSGFCALDCCVFLADGLAAFCWPLPGFGVFDDLGLLAGACVSAGFTIGLAAVRGLPLNAEPAASRWCLTDASMASRTRPGETGFNRKR